MLRAIFLVSALAVASAAVPAVRTTVELDGGVKGTSFKTVLGSIESPSLNSFEAKNDITPTYEEHQPVAVYSYSAVNQKEIGASTWLSSPMAEVLGAADEKTVYLLNNLPNSDQTEVASSRTGDLTVTAAYFAQGYNMSGTIHVLTNNGATEDYTVDLGGAGSASSISIAADGKAFAVVANVEASYVIPGHARAFCFVAGQKTPVHTVDLPAGQYADLTAGVMGTNGKIVFSTGTVLHAVDCNTGKVTWEFDRQYVATSLAMSPCGKYIATSFESFTVFEEQADGSFQTLIDAPLANGTTPFIGSHIAFSSAGQVAIGSYNGYTAKQNRIQLWNLATKDVAMTYFYKDVSDQQAQDTPAVIAFSEDGKRFVVGSWGDLNHTNPTVNLFCAVCGKVIGTFMTPGSVFTASITESGNTARVVVGGKHVHANIMGSGGDLYVLDFPLPGCTASDDAMVINHAEIARINSNPKSSWVAGENERFRGVSVRDVKKLMGAKINPQEIKAAGIPTEPTFASNFDDTPIPASFNVNQTWAGCEGPIRDQGQCGSCWATSAAEVLADRSCIANKQKGISAPYVVRSIEDLVSCDKRDYGCGGGFLYFAWEFMVESGVVAESCFPYTAGSGIAAACATSCVDSESWTPLKVDNSTLDFYGTEERIQRALMAGGSVHAAFNVFSDFMNYKSGVYVKTTDAFMGGHAVKIVGWGTDSASGLPYWEVSNSWGTAWGLEGKFWIRRGTNECGIEYNTIWGEPAI